MWHLVFSAHTQANCSTYIARNTPVINFTIYIHILQQIGIEARLFFIYDHYIAGKFYMAEVK